ncbi:ring-cleaving dioxygenase [Paenibacillus protaetiae]|uniref:Ring-cleaving dioxygenase n=1 Tax=Paenibacillus protaetiae TaxID=2509456 RepID=A0A4P6F0E2_9BACL|nr:ring-cleaving dioxygenase [Paenibacillus protaetiae]QAY68063.1 ring-cleaving dioxygenase [Paenibacillus protaetiae]
MMKKTNGIHHVTAFAGGPQQNVDFYAGVLGLRLVKKTINFDAPEVYHLYFGNETGSPGTAMTFFPSRGARKGKVGGGQVGYTTFAVPAGTMDFWEERLDKLDVPYNVTERLGERFVQFADPDGLQLELAEREEGRLSEWAFGGVPADKAIKGFGGALLYSIAPDQTIGVLTNVLGLDKVAEDADYIRFRAAGDIGNVIDLHRAALPWGAGGAGTVHHIAWRADNRPDQEEWREHVLKHGFQPTPVVDRQYFTAVYFREAGGILFEIATDDPGFVTDETFDELGGKVQLPEWYEKHRALIERNLEPITVRVLEGDQA